MKDEGLGGGLMMDGQTNKQTDRRTDKQTFVIVESLS